MTPTSSISYWDAAIAAGDINEAILQFVKLHTERNLAYTLVRSILLVEKSNIDELFDIVHHLAHGPEPTQVEPKPIEEENEVSQYWGDKINDCAECTYFLSEIILSSWRRFGREISQKNDYPKFGLVVSHLEDPHLVAIMTDTFAYMSAAYQQLEKDTKIAIQAKSHSADFMAACIDYFGLNFDTTNDAERLKGLLETLHNTTVNVMLIKLFGQERIEDTREKDRKTIEMRKKARDLALTLFEKAKSQTEQQNASTPMKGKNHEANRKKMDRKKKKRAAVSDGGVDVATSLPEDPPKEKDKSSINSAESPEGAILGDKSMPIVLYDPKKPPLFERCLDTDSDCSSGIEDTIASPNVKSDERNDKINTINDIVVSPEAVNPLIKLGNADLAESPKAGDFSKSSQLVPTSFEEWSSKTSLKDAQGKSTSHQDRENEGTILEVTDNDNGTQVVGSRKTPKEGNSTGVNHDIKGLPVKRSLQSGRHVNDLQESEKSGLAAKTAPSPDSRTSKFTSSQKPPKLSELALHPIDSGPGGSTKPISVTAVPKPSTLKQKGTAAAIPNLVVGAKRTHTISFIAEEEHPFLYVGAQVSHPNEQVSDQSNSNQDFKVSATDTCPPPTLGPVVWKQIPKFGDFSPESPPKRLPRTFAAATAPSSPVAPGAHSSSEPSVASTDLRAVAPEVHTNTRTLVTPPDLEVTTPEHRCSPKISVTATQLKATSPAAAIFSTSKSDHNRKNKSSISPSESIDPGLTPRYQHLGPFRNIRRMSAPAEPVPNTVTPAIIPTTDEVPLVEKSRDADVDDEALKPLVPSGDALSMASTRFARAGISSRPVRIFAGIRLNVRLANQSLRSAGNSPVAPQAGREHVYNCPSPDILTPANQEILDLIIKGPPYEKYPRVPTAAIHQETQAVGADYATKKPSITTYDGKDAYEVLGDRCPAPLTIKDHPNVNKCIRQGETFDCTYCQVKIPDNAEPEKSIICPGCGPCSQTRYCQRSHLLADSIVHSNICGKNPDAYPMLWSELPLHFQGLYPYIEPLTGGMTTECFRQMAHCLIINSDGVIQHPFKAYYDTKMPMEAKVKTYNYVEGMYQFQDKGSYYIFQPHTLAGGVDIEMMVALHDGHDGFYREDQRFARVRNAAFLTQHETLLCIIYRRIKAGFLEFPGTRSKQKFLLRTFHNQFQKEFPAFNAENARPIEEGYGFQDDWVHVRHLVHDLELKHPILRAWITEDAEDDGIPADPTARYQGKYWDLVYGPKFHAGSADRKGWGAGWYGVDDKKWQGQLDRKYLKMIADELAKVETELEGEIV